MNLGFLKITVSGDPFSIGEQHGRQAKQQIDVSINTYQKMFKKYNKLDWETALKRAEQYIPFIEKYDSDLLEELKGVAAGSERKIEEIVALNARSELALTSNMLGACTAFAVIPPASADGETYLGQNWDWQSSQKESIIILKIKQVNKPDILMVTEAGIIGKIGFNSAGIGVCLNALVTDRNTPGVPLHLVLRSILNSKTLGEAVGKVANAGIASAANFLIAHSDGEAIDLEALPGDFDYLYPERGLLTHANHFTSLRLDNFEDLGKKIFPDSLIRLNRINRLISAASGNIELETLKGIMRDHFNYPESICRHVNDTSKPKTTIESVFSIIMRLSKKEMFLTYGPPCQSNYIPVGE